MGTLNWTGWKFIYLPANSFTGSDILKFNSVVIRKATSGKSSGIVYLDLMETKTPGAEKIACEEDIKTTPMPFLITPAPLDI